MRQREVEEGVHPAQLLETVVDAEVEHEGVENPIVTP
jgi:hypothetical protein